MESSSNACSWAAFSPSPVDFCERNMCSWVVEPANTVSCIGYGIVGLILIRRARRDGARGALSWMGVIALLIGIFSAALHGTMTRLGNTLDLISMYLLATLLLLLNFRRLRPQSGLKGDLRAYVSANLALFLLLLLPGVTGIPVFAVLIAALAFSEIYLWRNAPGTDYRWFGATAAVFGGGFAVWSLDISRTLCNPDNHWLQGHAFWHFGSATAIYTFYRFYSQFQVAKRPVSGLRQESPPRDGSEAAVEGAVGI